MDRRTIAILLIVLAVLLPTWYVGLHGEPPSEEVRIDQSVSEMQPLEGFADTPNKLSPSQVGVIVWVALLGLLGAMAFFHRFMNQAARPDPSGGGPGDAGGATDAAATDGGGLDAPPPEGVNRATFPWFETEDRWVVEYHDASDAIEGLVAMGGLTALAIVFSALLTAEYLTLARTQYFGIYAFGLFMSLLGSTVSYYAWFMPHIEVAERRDH
ncbi:hypothetical protein [Halorubrum sp. N11]|uniref:hypothetical protein n=1 Tax=Halorubrum sp. N11 TaxID=3402276 RepID=UPI003EC07A1B